ncbi:hypothetical protein LY90DRAFT_672913 [Neocallimastix californiae]|uniref:Uncharacterized protein n=1 Tax=Neocallimastix californiae TaxID=1754190 RepID=A0A1Y2BR99_9FUNG|nr:hypothetical protein LY90DRAFT_672913 [Neocallimastix californiae]|eukprot:ORY37157.1 hypothetical protein LY90DRAFT_672913 [Neocallimastix californiae]
MYEMEYSYFTINNNDNRVEQWTDAWSYMFTSPYFGLLILTLILSYNNNNWKKPIYRIMILHWIIRALGEGFKSSGTLIYYNDEVHKYSSNNIGMIKKRNEKYNTNKEILYSPDHWKFAQGCGASLNYIGQIIGDWYLYLRTKTVVDNKKQMIFPSIFIILFNFSKAFQIFHFFVLNKDLYQKDHEGVNLTELVEFKASWWKINIVIFLFSFLYEISILWVLKKNVFTEFSKILENENSFLSRFKKISLYRLYITTSISVGALIVLVIFVIGTNKFNSNKDYINAYRGEPVGLDSLQNYAININYYMIYLDQILLKKYTNTKIIKTLNDVLTDNQIDIDSNNELY